jgi:hypothetical protein
MRTGMRSSHVAHSCIVVVITCLNALMCTRAHNSTFRWVPPFDHGGWDADVCFAVEDTASAACGRNASRVLHCVRVVVERCVYAIQPDQQLQEIAVFYEASWMQVRVCECMCVCMCVHVCVVFDEASWMQVRVCVCVCACVVFVTRRLRGVVDAGTCVCVCVRARAHVCACMCGI